MNAITMIWNRVCETGLPKTEPNTDTEFIVAVHRRAQDRVDVFAASFLNAKQLYSADELGEIAHDEGTKPVTGWYILTADDPNQDACWWNIIDDGSGDTVAAWMAMPPEPIAYVAAEERCEHCDGTGHSKLPNGERSDYLDCRHCGAAQERTDMARAVTDFVNDRRERLMDTSPSAIQWFVHQRARQIEREASATRIAELEAQLEDAEDMIAQVSHGAAERVSAIESECYALRQALSPPKIEDSHAWRAVPWKHLGKIMGLIDPEPIQIDGQTRVFQNPYAHEALREISRLVRAMMAEPVPEASAPPMTYAAAKAEQDSSLISILIDASQDGNTYPKSDYMRWCKRAADALSTALQAPVREVRKQRHVYDWLHLVETKIGTPTAASAARVLKEFYEGAEPDEPLPAAPVQKGGE